MAKSKKTTTRRKGFFSNIRWGFLGGLGATLGIGFSEGATFKEGLKETGCNIIGYEPSTASMSWDRAKKGALPLGLGILLSMVASKTGLNRYTPKWANI